MQLYFTALERQLHWYSQFASRLQANSHHLQNAIQRSTNVPVPDCPDPSISKQIN